MFLFLSFFGNLMSASLYVVLCVSVDMFAVLPLGLKKSSLGWCFYLKAIM